MPRLLWGPAGAWVCVGTRAAAQTLELPLEVAAELGMTSTKINRSQLLQEKAELNTKAWELTARRSEFWGLSSRPHKPLKPETIG